MENQAIKAAQHLYQYLYEKHWDGERLMGPDCGVRWNRRVLRYGKSLLPFVDWKDDYFYLQAQAYWIMSNINFRDVASEYDYLKIASLCANSILDAQTDEGYWAYPHPEWEGRIHTVDCTWAAIGMLAVYEADTAQEQLLAGAINWYKHLVNVTKFQEYQGTLAVNYFTQLGSTIVPNNTPVVLAYLARLSMTTQSDEYLEYAQKLIAFMDLVQLDDGEIPYKLKNEQGKGSEQEHFQCYQYNAFQLQHLAMYHSYTGDETVLPIIQRIAKFIAGGVKSDGSCRFDCQDTPHHAYYHTMVVSSSLGIARRLGLCDSQYLEDCSLNYILKLQRQDGSFPYSQDYYILPDNRSYPRTLSMTLYHLLNKHLDIGVTQQKEQAL